MGSIMNYPGSNTGNCKKRIIHFWLKHDEILIYFLKFDFVYEITFSVLDISLVPGISALFWSGFLILRFR
jgi:hypothetical protein